MKNCENSLPFCSGFVGGVIEGMNMTAATLNSDSLLCIPMGIRLEQAVLIVQRELKEHPEELHQSAATNVLVALSQAFPCRLR
jgi:hypothetical protein